MTNKFLEALRTRATKHIRLVVLLAVITFVLMTCSCSLKKFYPMGGAVLGGGTGALGGPAMAAVGAGTGWAAGELAKGDEELKEAQETITALTQGDVQTLVEKGLSEQRGTFDKIVDGIYDTLLICGIGIGLYLILPVLYTRYLHKKTNEQLTKNGQE